MNSPDPFTKQLGHGENGHPAAFVQVGVGNGIADDDLFEGRVPDPLLGLA